MHCINKWVRIRQSSAPVYLRVWGDGVLLSAIFTELRWILEDAHGSADGR